MEIALIVGFFSLPEKAREFLLRSSMMASLDSEATGE
jgi:hypothetical protein